MPRRSIFVLSAVVILSPRRTVTIVPPAHSTSTRSPPASTAPTKERRGSGKDGTGEEVIELARVEQARRVHFRLERPGLVDLEIHVVLVRAVGEDVDLLEPLKTGNHLLGAHERCHQHADGELLGCLDMQHPARVDRLDLGKPVYQGIVSYFDVEISVWWDAALEPVDRVVVRQEAQTDPGLRAASSHVHSSAGPVDQLLCELDR